MATKKETTKTTATGTTNKTTGWNESVTSGSSDLAFNSADERKTAWNSALQGRIDEAKAAGKNVYTGYDSNGMLHYSFNSQDKLNSVLDYYNTGNGTYNVGKQTYVVSPQEEQVQAPKNDSYDFGYITNYIDNTLAEQERIKSYYDTFLPSLMETGKAQADKAYEENSIAALNKRTEALRQYKENYINNVLTKNAALEQAVANKESQLNNVDDNYFAVLQQNRENAANRGLSNSGLMQALDQSIMSEANAQRAAIDQQYTAQVNQLNREISTLVETYGLNKAEADKIYNDTMQSLEAQRQADYQKVVAEAQYKAIEYEFGVDSFNANAFNQAQQSKAQLVTDAWKTKVNADTQITVAQIAANANMSIAQMQDATDRWKASLDSEDKKWLAQFNRTQQMEIASMDNASRELIARISANAGITAAKYAADLEYKLNTELYAEDEKSRKAAEQAMMDLLAKYGLDASGNPIDR